MGAQHADDAAGSNQVWVEVCESPVQENRLPTTQHSQRRVLRTPLEVGASAPVAGHPQCPVPLPTAPRWAVRDDAGRPPAGE